MLQSENANSKPLSDSLPTQVFEIPGEPAVVIDGVPDIPLTEGAPILSNASSEGHARRTVGCGEWLEGRYVRKFFIDRYYWGIMTRFDRETGWYRVEYEDGDSEDLEWHEVEEILQPLDVTMPLRELALKIVKNRQRMFHGSGQLRR